MNGSTNNNGLVSLVGAGPGDPDLLTRRAAQRLGEADVVFYDALVDRSALDLAPRAQRVFVGKRSGRPAVSQELIHRLMIRAARRGRRVVRLKGGDPFVFGRGGEEALALAVAGVRFEIVPGVSAAVAAPALAGIPVTHRRVASGFVVVSGHANGAWRPILDSLPPDAATIVVMMGLAHVEQISARLIVRGWKPSTPAAVILGAASAQTEVWTGSLEDLTAGIDLDAGDRPGVLVIGEVVRLRQALASTWMEENERDGSRRSG